MGKNKTQFIVARINYTKTKKQTENATFYIHKEMFLARGLGTLNPTILSEKKCIMSLTNTKNSTIGAFVNV